jgi:heme-degrading monooxygenase HmoA
MMKQNEGRIFSVARFNVSEADIDSVADAVEKLIRERLPVLTGFVEGTVLRSEARDKIVALTQWESRRDWAEAVWDEELQRTVTGLFEQTGTYDVEFYFPL